MCYLRKERGRWLFYKQTGIRGIESMYSDQIATERPDDLGRYTNCVFPCSSVANNSDDFIPVTSKALRDAKLK